MSETQTLRTFVAVPLPEAVESALDAVQREIKRSGQAECVRWVRPSSIHLTLFFLGDILPNRVEPVRQALSAIARHTPSFEVQAQGLGAFPNLRRPRVIWVGVDDSAEGLTLLHSAVNEAMENLGFKPDTRPFSPHLTLGRVRRRARRQEVDALATELSRMEVDALGTIPVEEMIFFQSELKPTGAKYTPLATFDFG